MEADFSVDYQPDFEPDFSLPDIDSTAGIADAYARQPPVSTIHTDP